MIELRPPSGEAFSIQLSSVFVDPAQDPDLTLASLKERMQKSADQAVAAVSVTVTAARPVAVIGKMLKHQVEQLHRLCDFRLGH